MTKHTLHFEMDDEVHVRLQSFASAKGLKLDDMIVEALIRTLEDASDMATVAEYLQHQASGTLETYEFKEITQRFGLED